MGSEKDAPTHPDVPVDPGHEPPKGDPEHPYESPGESKAGRGGIISPGGSQPKPSEDARDDSGIAHPEQS